MHPQLFVLLGFHVRFSVISFDSFYELVYADFNLWRSSIHFFFIIFPSQKSFQRNLSKQILNCILLSSTSSFGLISLIQVSLVILFWSKCACPDSGLMKTLVHCLLLLLVLLLDSQLQLLLLLLMVLILQEVDHNVMFFQRYE